MKPTSCGHVHSPPSQPTATTPPPNVIVIISIIVAVIVVNIINMPLLHSIAAIDSPLPHVAEGVIEASRAGGQSINRGLAAMSQLHIETHDLRQAVCKEGNECEVSNGCKEGTGAKDRSSQQLPPHNRAAAGDPAAAALLLHCSATPAHQTHPAQGPQRQILAPQAAVFVYHFQDL